MITWIVLLICIYVSHFNCDSNLTEYNSYPSCPITYKRIKRVPIEYTRWRANLETSSEFIVKIFDEDLTTPKAKKIVAVNIEPITKGMEKIIIGEAITSQRTPVSPFMMSTKDYTRFVLPTTIPVEHVEGELYIAPVRPKPTGPNISLKQIQANTPRSARKNPERDDSPPAGPQFLQRTRGVLSQQFAAVTPVAFATRSSVKPVLPPSIEYHDIRQTSRGPTRTALFPDLTFPTRTTIQNEDIFFADIQTTKVLKTFTEQQHPPQRTSLNQYEFIDADESIYHTTTNTQEPAREDEENKNNGIDFLRSDYTSKSRDADYDHKPNRTTRYEDAEYNYDYNQKSINPIEKKYTTKEDFKLYTDLPISKKDLKDIIMENATDARKSIVHNKVCDLVILRNLSFNSPRTLPEIVSQLKIWAETSPLVKLVDVTNGNLTTMENKIHLVIVDDPSSGQIVSAKQIILIVAGIQGRDHHAVSTAVYVLYQLIERSEAHPDLLSKFRFWIIPVFNPDGYDYSMTFPHRREWAKNLKQTWNTCIGKESCYACENYGLGCTVQPCYGVNLDRNFEYQWIPTEELRSEHPCGNLYAGPRQLSESETKALSQFLHQQTTQLFTFIAFKEGEILGVLYPYSHTRKKRTFDHIYRQRASRAAAAAASISGRPYLAGQTSEFLPLYAGGIEDWVDGHLGIDNTYTIMMFRQNDAYNSKLATERVVHEAYAAMDTLLLQSVEPLGPREATVLKESSGKVAHTSYILLLISFLSGFG